MAITVTLALALLCMAGTVGCNSHHRRPSPPPPGSSETDDFEPAGDPRFPRAGTERTGLWFEEPRVRGSLSRSVVLEVANDHRDRLRNCLPEEASKKKRPEGRMLLELEVEPDGRVRSSKIGETSIYDRSFRDCVLEETARWSFEPGPGASSATVYLPMNLRWDRREPSDGGP